jgi:hypothetical protein
MSGVRFETGIGLQQILWRGSQEALSGLGVQGHPLLLSRGRDCLAIACQALALQPGDEILMPAFICHEVTQCLRSWGFTPVLYDLNRDLSLNLADLQQRQTSRTRVALYVHYFGFPQAGATLLALKDLGLAVIEDCSQSPFPVRSEGCLPDFAFTSLRKYLPVPDGALLDVIATDRQAPALEASQHLKTSGRFVCSRTAALLMRRLQERRDRQVWDKLAHELFAQAARQLRTTDTPRRMHSRSRRVTTHHQVDAIRARRRENYEAFAAGLEGAERIKLLFPELPPQVCPYVCPILVPNNRLWGDALNQKGIEAAVLWDCREVGEAYPNTQWLSRHLLSIPVAQGNPTEALNHAGAILRDYDAD